MAAGNRTIAMLDVTASVAMIAASFGVVAMALTVTARRASRPNPAATEAPIPRTPISLVGAKLLGSDRAPVAVIEYADLQCPFCAQFAKETFPDLRHEYVDSGRILWAFRHFPLESLHPAALRAAEAAECAAAQGKFWEMQALIFARPEDLSEAGLRRDADQLGLGGSSFASCLGAGGAKGVEADETSAQTLAVTGTPSFFVGQVLGDLKVRVTQRFSGAARISSFRAALDSALASSASSDAR